MIKSNNSKNLKLLATIAKQLGENVNKISTAQAEYLELGLFIKREKTENQVSRDELFKLFDSK